MLTGIEQYHFERAGYFVRRGLLTPERLAEVRADPRVAPPEVAALAEDILGAGRFVIARPAAAAYGTEWRRADGPAVDAPIAEQLAALAAGVRAVEARLALTDDDGLRVLPGSHEEPVSPETLASPAPPEAVRIRLSSGDSLFMSAALLRASCARDDGPPVVAAYLMTVTVGRAG